MKQSPQRAIRKLERIISSDSRLETPVPFLPVLPGYIALFVIFFLLKKRKETSIKTSDDRKLTPATTLQFHLKIDTKRNINRKCAGK